MEILLIGAPGAGKGTLAAKLIKEFNISHISTGQMLREAVQSGSELGKKVEDVMNSGQLVSDELMIEVVKNALTNNPSYILDGFPRTVPQAEALAGFSKLKYALYLEVADSTVIKRLSGRRSCLKCFETYNVYFDKPAEICRKCHVDLKTAPLVLRKDDEEEVVKKRLNLFHKVCDPLLKFYSEKNILFTIDAGKGQEETFQEALAILV